MKLLLLLAFVGLVAGSWERPSWMGKMRGRLAEMRKQRAMNNYDRDSTSEESCESSSEESNEGGGPRGPPQMNPVLFPALACPSVLRRRVVSQEMIKQHMEKLKEMVGNTMAEVLDSRLGPLMDMMMQCKVPASLLPIFPDGRRGRIAANDDGRLRRRRR